ncbi:TPA: four helix bundle protein [Candidatus Kaiserbacteria bacterium]|nr:four helix bundle protein [Candidatus Kaiserbacteria bacterium]
METKQKNTERRFDLEERSLSFAKNVRAFVKDLPRSIANIEDTKQLVRSSGSIGANYIEANESVGKKDFLFRIRIARKEAKESKYWLRLIEAHTASIEKQRAALEQEATELMLILSSIMRKYV